MRRCGFEKGTVFDFRPYQRGQREAAETGKDHRKQENLETF
jgi:hypothetical protein